MDNMCKCRLAYVTFVCLKCRKRLPEQDLIERRGNCALRYLSSRWCATEPTRCEVQDIVCERCAHKRFDKQAILPVLEES